MAKQKDTNAEYQSNSAISRSSLFQMSRSPAHFKYAMENKEQETDALRFGTMFHAFVFSAASITCIPMSPGSTICTSATFRDKLASPPGCLQRRKLRLAASVSVMSI